MKKTIKDLKVGDIMYILYDNVITPMTIGNIIFKKEKVSWIYFEELEDIWGKDDIISANYNDISIVIRDNAICFIEKSDAVNYLGDEMIKLIDTAKRTIKVAEITLKKLNK